MKKTLLLHAAFLVLLCINQIPFTSFSQPVQQMIKVVVSPDHENWLYKAGETASFTVAIYRYNSRLSNVQARYSIGTDMLDPTQSGSINLAQTSVIKMSAPGHDPGFIRCTVIAEIDGKEYEGRATVGFSPEQIKPTVQMPGDFEEFWKGAMIEAAKVPLDSRITLLADRSTEKVNVYHVSFQNDITASRIYGILSMPKANGKYPALLKVPGAGVRPYFGDQEKAAKGIITLEIGIHGIPVNMDKQIYDDLSASALRGYMFNNPNNRDKYYYKKVYLGCVKAVDFLYSLPQFGGKTVGVMGGSQGGALSVVTAALDPRIDFLACMYPALSDMTGYLHNRGGGWPHIFRKENAGIYANEQVIKTLSYYDVANFAKLLKVPGFYSWGFNDATCPPVSTYSVYNSIKAKKELLTTPDTGHWTYPEQLAAVNQWMVDRLLSVKDR